MRANRNVSAAETRFGRALWAAGARGYRRNSRLPGRPDFAFSAIQMAIFVHGCYWHRCPSCALPLPKANAEFWREKFRRNVERDGTAETRLTEAGWKVVTVWEHEIREDLDGAARRVAQFVASERMK